MTQHRELKYKDFVDRIDVDAFEEAIGFESIEQKGDNDIGYCVFPENHTHGDTTGKFAIEREQKLYNCWACGGGSFVSLVMELFDFDPDEAVEWLYQFAGDKRTDQEFVDHFLASFADAERRIASLPYYNPRVLEQWAYAYNFGHERGISDDVIKEYEIRYVEEARKPAPQRGKFADDPDYYGPAILFPHYWNKRLVGWQYRWLNEDRPHWVKKYTNTPDFPKELTVYNYDYCLKQKGLITVVESVPTSLYLRSLGYPALATFGAQINDPQMRLLRRFQDGLILSADNDKAGVKWRNTATTLQRFVPIFWLPPVVKEVKADLGDLNPNEVDMHYRLMSTPWENELDEEIKS